MIHVFVEKKMMEIKVTIPQKIILILETTEADAVML